MERRWAYAVATMLAAAATACGAGEFTFDASKFEKKPLEFGGYVELKHESFSLNQAGAFYALNYLGQPRRSTLDRTTATFKPSMKLRTGIATLSARGHVDNVDDNLASERTNRFDELIVSIKPDPSVTIEAGKTAFKWGKGYAWSPVAFIERAKDPNDPELAREGYTAVSADLIRNFDGPLQTVALTPVLLPVSGQVNGDYGSTGHLNAAAKLYLLYRDTDIDFVFLNNGSRSRRVGIDFSRNVTSNLEIHGEWARISSLDQRIVDPSGNVSMRSATATSFLLGARYLTAKETTYLIEYYRNGTGYTEQQTANFFQLVNNGVSQQQASGNTALLQKAGNAAQSGYSRPNAGRNYAYARISNKEPFDILYFTPAITAILNLDDRSYSVAPEATYTGINNVELRVRATFLSGGENTEFGEKANARKVEFYARYYF